jgi:hypothetical protein
MGLFKRIFSGIESPSGKDSRETNKQALQRQLEKLRRERDRSKQKRAELKNEMPEKEAEKMSSQEKTAYLAQETVRMSKEERQQLLDEIEQRRVMLKNLELWAQSRGDAHWDDQRLIKEHRQRIAEIEKMLSMDSH